METISLRFDAEEREMLRKQHIKHELLDYRYYLDKAKWLKEKITLLDERLNGGIGSAPLGAYGTTAIKGDWIVAAISEQDELIKEKKIVDNHIETVQRWLGILSKQPHEAVYCYVIVHNCKELEECTKLLEMTNSKALLRLIDRSIAEISQNI